MSSGIWSNFFVFMYLVFHDNFAKLEDCVWNSGRKRRFVYSTVSAQGYGKRQHNASQVLNATAITVGTCMFHFTHPSGICYSMHSSAPQSWIISFYLFFVCLLQIQLSHYVHNIFFHTLAVKKFQAKKKKCII